MIDKILWLVLSLGLVISTNITAQDIDYFDSQIAVDGLALTLTSTAKVAYNERNRASKHCDIKKVKRNEKKELDIDYESIWSKVYSINHSCSEDNSLMLEDLKLEIDLLKRKALRKLKIKKSCHKLIKIKRIKKLRKKIKKIHLLILEKLGEIPSVNKRCEYPAAELKILDPVDEDDSILKIEIDSKEESGLKFDDKDFARIEILDKSGKVLFDSGIKSYGKELLIGKSGSLVVGKSVVLDMDKFLIERDLEKADLNIRVTSINDKGLEGKAFSLDFKTEVKRLKAEMTVVDSGDGKLNIDTLVRSFSGKELADTKGQLLVKDSSGKVLLDSGLIAVGEKVSLGEKASLNIGSKSSIDINALLAENKAEAMDISVEFKAVSLKGVEARVQSASLSIKQFEIKRGDDKEVSKDVSKEVSKDISREVSKEISKEVFRELK